ncbi:hypothetical protein BO86DRAFT_389963 [Aspergillus japonicus CBS 114.51]|uniref:Uncharacterized protein n=2 Tax=Aspergillus TaxID=5052 RepID=A0A2V5HH66_ASPV1|nr:hypothetical protein BO86DRAFT_389963 [Aspergillus japonicus CBS 114.51]PYI23121.1 hypothetical protein BO99DRAFT_399473 [Aspergillus violaceofuscus CBS 115571]RAH81001.1 hypothetical protein BO86DRAFT_389963 [Aspergillus japonicus CBS 114.51]
MVRIKHRYLLLDILYPDPTTWPRKPVSVSSSSTPQLQIHAPTSDALTPSLLAKLVREQVAELFGDWGVGRLGGAGAGGVSGMFSPSPYFPFPGLHGVLLWEEIVCSFLFVTADSMSFDIVCGQG